MNKRIKELMKQAGLSYLYEYDEDGGHAMVCNPDDIQKLTDLIISDVLLITDNLKTQYLNNRKEETDFSMKNIYAEGESACETIKRKVKKQFGVKQ